MNDAAVIKPILSVRHLKATVRPKGLAARFRGGLIRAVDDFHLDLRHGEILGITGAAGSGKSVLAQCLAGLLPLSGSIRFAGQERIKATKYRQSEIWLIDQLPLSGIKPKKKMAEALQQPLLQLQLQPQRSIDEHKARLAEALAFVGLDADIQQRASREIGSAQRWLCALAQAISIEPKLLICDEPPVDALGRDALIDLLLHTRRKLDLSLIVISKNLEFLREISSRVLVMYLGKVMEQAPTPAMFGTPRHPYSRELFGTSIEDSNLRQSAGESAIRLAAPDPLNPPMGCVFHTRCPLMESSCMRSAPNLRRVGDEHFAACHFVA